VIKFWTVMEEYSMLWIENIHKKWFQLHDMTFWTQQNYGILNFSDCHWKGPRMRRWSSDYVQGRETNAEDTVVVDAWRHVFGRNHMTVQQKLNTKPWILDNNNISILPTSLKKYTTLMYKVNNTGKWWGWGGRTVVKKCCHFCLFYLILHQK
jgi:hypothetical protein